MTTTHPANPETPVTALLAQFTAETAPDDIPAMVRSRALLTIADTLATAVAGLSDPSTRVLRDAFVPWAAAGPSRLVGSAIRTDPAIAALLNSAAAHALDFDAISFAVSGFVGSATIAALAALVDAGVADTGSDVLTAYCVGWEVAAAVGRGVNPTHYAKGWHPTATLGTFATTAACCRLAGLSAERTAVALSVAVSEASGVKTMIGNMLNPYHVGTSARNGVVAAQLAAAGFVGNGHAFEAEQGFLNLFNGPGQFDAEQIVAGLGSAWDLADPGPVIKIYPCCGLMHSALDALLSLRAEYGFGPSDVRTVTVRVHEYVPKVMHINVPDSGYAAKFSVPYCASAALIDGRCDLATFEAVRPEVVEYSSRIRVEVHPELQGGATFFGEEFSEVAVETATDLLVRRVYRMENRGTAGNLTIDDVGAKLVDCFRHAGAAGDPESAWKAVRAADAPAPFVLWELADGPDDGDG